MDILNEPEQNYKSGYIRVYRSVKNHWLYEKNRKRTKLEAWYDLLFQANHSPTKEPVGYDRIMVNRGQILTSQEKLSAEWRWDRSSVRLFLNSLHLDQMLTIETTNKYTMITICNYGIYQDLSPLKPTATSPTKQHQPNINPTQISNYKELNKVINIEFMVFWNLYNKKVGDKSGCEKKWVKLKDAEREKIIDMLPIWKNQFTNIQFQPFPETFLNQKRWEDVVEDNSDDDIDMNTYQLN